ncbi:DUF4340 domain-containing protein [Chloroflexota bacterium]
MRLRNIIILLVILLVVGGYFYYSSRPEPPPPKEPQPRLWSVEVEELQHMVIRLTHENMSQEFVKGADRYWYFDDIQRSKIDDKRWGGGIPVLLRGPGMERVIAENATAEKIAEFGLAQPQMEITLTMQNGDILHVKVGDSVPDGHAYYVQSPYSNDVATVDRTWYEVIERLVTEPPYAPPTAD